MAKVLVLETEEGVNYFRVAECETLDDFYENLKCDIFDIANRNIGGKRFDIYVDDVGLFRENPKVSAVRINGNDIEPMLVGNLVIANHDAHGNTTSLSDDDISLIIDSLIGVMKYDNKIDFVLKCDY